MKHVDTIPKHRHSVTLGDVFGPAAARLPLPGAPSLHILDPDLAGELLTSSTALATEVSHVLGDAATDSAPDVGAAPMVVLSAPDTTIRYCSPALASLLGFESVADLLNTGQGLNLLPPNERQEGMDDLQNILSSGGAAGVTYHLTHKNGTLCPVEIHASALADAHGSIHGIISIIRDVPSRIPPQTPMPVDATMSADWHMAWGHLFDQSPIGMVVAGLDGRCLAANPAFCRMIGYSAQELAGQHFHAFSHPDDVAISVEKGRQMIEGSLSSFQIEKRYLHKDGHTIWVTLNASVIRSPSGEALAVLSQIQDVTAHKLAERQAKISLERYRAIVEDQTELICRYLPDTTLTFVNEAYCRYFGYQRHELLGRRFAQPDLISAEALAEVQQRLSTLSADNRLLVHEHPVRRADGALRWMQWVNRAIVDDSGQVVELQAIGRDITERREMEQALRESEARYRALVETAADGILMADLCGIIRFANPQAARLYGYEKPAEMIGKSILEFTPPAERPAVLERASTARAQGMLQNVIHTQVRCDGAIFIAEGSTALIHSAHNAPDAYLIVVRDVTERQRVERAEREQRLLAEALRDTAAALAGTLDYEEVLDRILDNAGRVIARDTTHAICSNIMLLDPPCPLGAALHGSAGVVACVVRARGYPADATGRPAFKPELPVSQINGFCHMIASGESLLVRDTHADPTWAHYAETEWLRSHVGAPLIVRGTVLGFLNLDSAIPELFSAHDTSRLRAFADQAAVAISNAQLFESQRQSVARLTRVHQAGLAVAQTTSMDDLLSTIARQAVQLTGADAAVLSRFDGVGHLIGAAAEGLPQSMIGMRVALGEGLSGRAAALRTAQRVNDYHKWGHHVDMPSSLGFESGAAVPLVWQDRLIGALAVISRQHTDMTDEDVNMLALFGTLAAASLALRSALDDARRRESEARDLARELITARDDERNCIAERLHNAIGHLLLALQKAIQSNPPSPGANGGGSGTLQTHLSLLNEVSEQVRALAMDLDSQVLEQSGIAAAGRRYVERIAASVRRRIHFHVTGRVRRMPIEIERVLFRGLKEALTNALQHAQAGEISAQLHIGSRSARLTVQDDGIGFDSSILDLDTHPALSFGLAGLRRQASLLAGDFSVESAPGQGTTLMLEIPLPADPPCDGQRVRVLIADAHDVTRRGLVATLHETGEYECVEARDGLSAVHLAEISRQDVALISVDLPELNGIEAARQIVATMENTAVIMLSFDHSQQAVEQARRIGARGFLLKSASSQELLQALRRVRAGEMFYSPGLAGAIRSLQEEPDAHDALASLTTREREVLELIVNGYRNRQIAERLGISVRTVEVHRRNIMDKLGARSLAQLIKQASRRDEAHL